ncbi:MAG: hypothetical protein HGB37_01330 [Candidatus Moranbacteria bacterium]|jgi:hypothetical protein|nr:hypothetical protein [Candidatus Moranbacteria bacterium]
MSTPADAACPQTISEPTNWLGTVITHLKNILFAPIEFGMGIVEGVADTLSLVGHGIQIAETAVISAAGNVLEKVVETMESALDACLEWIPDILADTIGDAAAEAFEFVFVLLGIEIPSFGCYGM